MGDMDYLAHISEDGLRREPVSVHLSQVADMAASFADVFGGSAWGYAVGMAHDIGKYSKAFQHRLLDGGPKCDHSTAGAVELAKQPFGWMLSYCAAGHHGGLPNGGTLLDDGASLAGRIAKAGRGELPDYTEYKNDVSVSVPVGLPMFGIDKMAQSDMAYALAFRTRMLFSCLVDADYLCTERFIDNKDRELGGHDDLVRLQGMLEKKIASFYPPATDLNAARCHLLEQCAEAAEGEPGVYSLTVPTGGGKTLSSMRFALRHACAHGMRRVIYAAPYTSIIEQNADVYRGLFGSDNVLEHHADFDFDTLGESGGRMRLAAENWDAPVVVTTNVQVFESLHSDKTSRCRKLHNIAGSVIILDEAQMIPTDYLRPCVRALAELVNRYGCTVLLCTATQPAINPFFAEAGLSVKEIAGDVDRLFDTLRRVTYIGLGKIDDSGLARRLASHNQALCIVNNRTQAKNLFNSLVEFAGKDGCYHLSTLMHPTHRRITLKEIRTRLASGAPCCVVSTSLVEAGVDLDFPVVYRAIAGLDSIVQAAGRCNREGKMNYADARVFLFDPETSYALPIETRHRIGVIRSVDPLLFEKGELGDVGTPDSVERYFKALYSYKEYGSSSSGVSGLDKQGIVMALSEPRVLTLIEGAPKALSYPFRDVASSFKIIADGSYSVVIPCGEIEGDLELLMSGTISRDAIRHVSCYAVSVYEQDLKALYASGLVDRVADDLFLLLDANTYSETTGLDVRAEGGKGVFL